MCVPDGAIKLILTQGGDQKIACKSVVQEILLNEQSQDAEERICVKHRAGRTHSGNQIPPA